VLAAAAAAVFSLTLVLLLLVAIDAARELSNDVHLIWSRKVHLLIVNHEVINILFFDIYFNCAYA
jgi:hypothetical protein